MVRTRSQMPGVCGASILGPQCGPPKAREAVASEKLWPAADSGCRVAAGAYSCHPARLPIDHRSVPAALEWLADAQAPLRLKPISANADLATL